MRRLRPARRETPRPLCQSRHEGRTVPDRALAALSALRPCAIVALDRVKTVSCCCVCTFSYFMLCVSRQNVDPPLREPTIYDASLCVRLCCCFLCIASLCPSAITDRCTRRVYARSILYKCTPRISSSHPTYSMDTIVGFTHDRIPLSSRPCYARFSLTCKNKSP